MRSHQTGGCHEDAVVILPDVLLGEISWLAGHRFLCHHPKLCRMVQEAGIVERIFSVLIAQGSVDVFQIDVGMGVEKIVQAHVFLPKCVIVVEEQVAPHLTGQIGCKIGASGRNTDAKVKLDVFFQAPVQHTRGIDAAHSAANIHNSCFHLFFLPFSNNIFSILLFLTKIYRQIGQNAQLVRQKEGKRM